MCRGPGLSWIVDPCLSCCTPTRATPYLRATSERVFDWFIILYSCYILRNKMRTLYFILLFVLLNIQISRAKWYLGKLLAREICEKGKFQIGYIFHFVSLLHDTYVLFLWNYPDLRPTLTFYGRGTMRMWNSFLRILRRSDFLQVGCDKFHYRNIFRIISSIPLKQTDLPCSKMNPRLEIRLIRISELWDISHQRTVLVGLTW